jgi:hypothetical protein
VHGAGLHAEHLTVNTRTTNLVTCPVIRGDRERSSRRYAIALLTPAKSAARGGLAQARAGLSTEGMQDCGHREYYRPPGRAP